MPGIATPQLLNYAEIVDVDLDATNDVNFADVEDYGHRVVVEMNTEALNNYLGWERAVGSARPHAKLTAANEAAFKGAIEAALAGGFVDIDGVTGGLHFGTANLDTNPDPRKRAAEGVGANDLPLCFVLYKLYGSSAATTLDRIYNLEDAHAMLSNSTVATAIAESFKAAEAGAVDKMFRDLLSADPHRFFDASGLPMVGIFETNADVSGAGNWKMVADDTLEIKLKMIFHSRVTRRGVAGQEHNLSSTAAENEAASQANQQTVINPDDYFYVRLQLKSSTDAGAGSGGSGSGSGSTPARYVTRLVNVTRPGNGFSLNEQASQEWFQYYGPNIRYLKPSVVSGQQLYALVGGSPVTFVYEVRDTVTNALAPEGTSITLIANKGYSGSSATIEVNSSLIAQAVGFDGAEGGRITTTTNASGQTSYTIAFNSGNPPCYSQLCAGETAHINDSTLDYIDIVELFYTGI